ncbi:MAG: DUF3501 family protein [Nitrospirales bacterium]
MTKDDLMPFVEYERDRPAFRERIIALKRRRRIAVGDRVSLVFENRDTMQFQIQEMIRAERIFDPHKIQDELEVYNALLPGDGELSATLMIEITDKARIQVELDRFQGVDRGRTLSLRAGSHQVFAEFEGGRSKEDKISAVHFVRVRPDAGFLEALKQPQSALSIVLEHGSYRAAVPVPEALREEWLADLGLGVSA